jgi:hypothetical protein
MAQKTIIRLTDDLDGSEAVETITFALDGVSYEIDLNQKNASKLRKALGPFAEAGRKQRHGTGPGPARRGLAPRSTGDGHNPVLVRAWAESQGIEVAARGRVPAEIIEKYRAAH